MYSREDFESDCAAINSCRAAINRAVAKRRITGGHALDGWAALDRMEERCQRRLAAVARSIEDRARDRWRAEHVIEFPRPRQ